MTIIASLHSIQCEGPGACSCSPIYVRETPEQVFDSWDNQDAEVAAQSHSVESRAARSGELPLIGRATARNTGGRP